MARSSWSGLFWMACLFLGAAGLTVAGFVTFIPPWHRSFTFYAVIAFNCVAELALCGYGGMLLVTGGSPKRPAHAVHIRVLWLMVLWVLALLVSGGFAVRPSLADTFYSDKIILIQSVFTFLVFAGVYLFQRQATVLAGEQAAPQAERAELRAYAGGIEPLLAMLRRLGQRHPERTVALDRLARRLDMVRTQLLAASPRAARDESEVLVQGSSNAEVHERLHDLHERVRRLENGLAAQFDEDLAQAGEAAEQVVNALRHREGAVLS